MTDHQASPQDLAVNETPAVQRKRAIKLPLPGFQLRLIAWFGALSALALLGQFLLISSQLSRFAHEMPEGGAYLFEHRGELLFQTLVFSFGMLLPITVLIGIRATFKWAGPLYRYHQHLREVAAGETTAPCRVRAGDDLQELCTLINAAIDTTRARAQAGDTSPPTAEPVRLEQQRSAA